MSLKFLVVFASIVAAVVASDYYAKPAPYTFGYQIADHYGGHGRHESGDGYGNKKGSYSLTDADGRVRKVDYVADDYGFRAAIKTNEPGTNGKDSADAVVNGPDSYGAYGAVAHRSVAPVSSYGVHGYVAAPKYGGYSRSYSYNAPSYGQGGYGYGNGGYGYGTPSYGYSRSYNYATPAYGRGLGSYGVYGYAAPSNGYSKSYSYSAAPSYGYGRH
ncbi:Uncharacterised protein g4050 [Pycnogonum litorale]